MAETGTLPTNLPQIYRMTGACSKVACEGIEILSLVGSTKLAVTRTDSTDFVGSRQACVIDSQATIVEGNHVVLYCWYDNEFGYSCQVVRCLEKFAGVNWPAYPSN